MFRKAIALGGWQIVDPPPVEMHFAGGRGVERAQQVQERALARAALADDRQELAAADFEIDAGQHGNLDRPLAIVLLQADRGEFDRRSVERQYRRCQRQRLAGTIVLRRGELTAGSATRLHPVQRQNRLGMPTA